MNGAGPSRRASVLAIAAVVAPLVLHRSELARRRQHHLVCEDLAEDALAQAFGCRGETPSCAGRGAARRGRPGWRCDPCARTLDACALCGRPL